MRNIAPWTGQGRRRADGAEIVAAGIHVIIGAISRNRVLDDNIVHIGGIPLNACCSVFMWLVCLDAVVIAVHINSSVMGESRHVIAVAGVAENLAAVAV